MCWETGCHVVAFYGGGLNRPHLSFASLLLDRCSVTPHDATHYQLTVPWRNAAAAADDDDDELMMLMLSSSVMVNDVVFVSSMSVDSLARRLYWIDSAKVSCVLRSSPTAQKFLMSSIQ